MNFLSSAKLSGEPRSAAAYFRHGIRCFKVKISGGPRTFEAFRALASLSIGIVDFRPLTR
ncbi:30S ribosomal protein S11 domain protein [Oribacterium sp. oral taxon 078 str. F0263]|nr:30S ribosomal protein S11 domain protein [Oribacterium sp. oral taxon 078 str. F0263]